MVRMMIIFFRMKTIFLNSDWYPLIMIMTWFLLRYHNGVKVQDTLKYQVGGKILCILIISQIPFPIHPPSLYLFLKSHFLSHNQKCYHVCFLSCLVKVMFPSYPIQQFCREMIVLKSCSDRRKLLKQVWTKIPSGTIALSAFKTRK